MGARRWSAVQRGRKVTKGLPSLRVCLGQSTRVRGQWERRGSLRPGEGEPARVWADGMSRNDGVPGKSQPGEATVKKWRQLGNSWKWALAQGKNIWLQGTRPVVQIPTPGELVSFSSRRGVEATGVISWEGLSPPAQRGCRCGSGRQPKAVGLVTPAPRGGEGAGVEEPKSSPVDLARPYY